MIQIIAGEKGKGKTKIILDKANSEVLTSNGSVIYIDKSNKHMHELDKNVRLIDIKEFFITNAQEFVGFVSGIISQNRDITTVFLDSFLTVAAVDVAGIDEVINKLDVLSGAFNVNFVLSVSANADALSKSAREKVIVAL